MGICSKIQGSLYILWLQSGWNAAGGKSLDQMGRTLRLEMLTVLQHLPWFKTLPVSREVIVQSLGSFIGTTLLPLTTKRVILRRFSQMHRDLATIVAIYIFFPHGSPASKVSLGRPWCVVAWCWSLCPLLADDIVWSNWIAAPKPDTHVAIWGAADGKWNQIMDPECSQPGPAPNLKVSSD